MSNWRIKTGILASFALLFSLLVLLPAAERAAAKPSFSKDGKCTPCHPDGRKAPSAANTAKTATQKAPTKSTVGKGASKTTGKTTAKKTVHPQGWLALHGDQVVAKNSKSACLKCHQTNNFCVSCHVKAVKPQYWGEKHQKVLSYTAKMACRQCHSWYKAGK